MANNRLFLVHIPTGLAVFLGKNMGLNWYSSSEEKIGPDVSRLFKVIEEVCCGEHQDDFAVAMENTIGATLAIGAWDYGKERNDGLVQLLMNHPE